MLALVSCHSCVPCARAGLGENPRRWRLSIVVWFPTSEMPVFYCRNNEKKVHTGCLPCPAGVRGGRADESWRAPGLPGPVCGRVRQRHWWGGYPIIKSLPWAFLEVACRGHRIALCGDRILMKRDSLWEKVQAGLWEAKPRVLVAEAAPLNMLHSLCSQPVPFLL